MKTKLIVLYGGKSAEHDVSVQTAFSVIKAVPLDKFDIKPIYITNEGDWISGPDLTEAVHFAEQLRFLDSETMAISQVEGEPSKGKWINPGEILNYRTEDTVVFPLLHGPNGEDGTIQGFLEVLQLPYVGNGVLSSAAAMDKIVMKKVFADAGIPQVPAVSLRVVDWEKHQEEMLTDIEEVLQYPMFVKPANMGSSVGITKATSKSSLADAIHEAFRFDRRIVIEQGVDAREIELAVLGNDAPVCSVPGEILPEDELAPFYDYKTKYTENKTKLSIPANIESSVLEQMKEYAVQAYLGLDAAGLVRADFFLTKDNQILLNEVNTMPGFTPYSMYPLLWNESGIAYQALIERLVELAKERYDVRSTLTHRFLD